MVNTRWLSFWLVIKWLGFQISDHIWNPDHLQPNLFRPFKIQTRIPTVFRFCATKFYPALKNDPSFCSTIAPLNSTGRWFSSATLKKVSCTSLSRITEISSNRKRKRAKKLLKLLKEETRMKHSNCSGEKFFWLIDSLDCGIHKRRPSENGFWILQLQIQ